MKTREFIEQLRGSRGKQLVFVDENDMTIHGGYHLTDIKTATFETVDCGGGPWRHLAADRAGINDSRLPSTIAGTGNTSTELTRIALGRRGSAHLIA